jgi:hypothetical protein
MNTLHENLPAYHLPFFTVFDGIIIALIVFGLFFISWSVFKNPHINLSLESSKPYTPKNFDRKKELTHLRSLAKNEDWKAFVLLATNILKHILEESQHKRLSFATGKELFEELKDDFSADQLKDLKRFFFLVDPVKFAKAKGKNELADEIFLLLQHF